MSDGIPETRMYFEKCHFFGYVKVFIEDRRPDLNYEGAKATLGYKYKIQIVVKVLFKEYYFSFRSLNVPYISVDGKKFASD